MSPRPLICLSALLVVAATLAPRTAQAQDTTPYAAVEEIELSASVALAAGSLLMPGFFMDSELAEPACGECDIETINALDRPVTGYDSGAARLTSDITVGTLIAAPFLLGLADTQRAGGGGMDDYLTDATILAETLAINLFAVQLVKHAARRPRPFTYNPDAEHERKLKVDSTLSFFSGHSSTSFSMAVAYAITYQERNPDDPMRFAVWGGGLSLAALTAGLRIAGGKHFWSDVLTGTLVGTAIGILVPVLHLRDDRHRDDGPNTGRQGLGATPLMIGGAF